MPYTYDNRLEPIGAAGEYGLSSNNGEYRGRGVRRIGNFSLTKSEIIHILVGHGGGINNVCNSGGGGGGTFVVRETDNAPFIIAGAEGGIETVTFRPEGCDASTSTTIHGQRGSDGQGTQIANISNSAEQTHTVVFQSHFYS